MKYVHMITGAVIETDCVLEGEHWKPAEGKDGKADPKEKPKKGGKTK